MVVLGEVSIQNMVVLGREHIMLDHQNMVVLGEEQIDLVHDGRRHLSGFLMEMEMVEGGLEQGSKRRSDLNFAHINTNASVH